MEIVGLRTCDTCRRTKIDLEQAGLAVTFRDVRDTPLTENEIADLLRAFGDVLVNRRSTTWRTLGEAERLREPAALLVENPTLMKRPVIRSGDDLYLGWTDETRMALGL